MSLAHTYLLLAMIHKKTVYHETNCCCSVAQSCPTLWYSILQYARLPCPSPSPELAQTHVHWVGNASNHPILRRPLLLLPPIFPIIRVFINKFVLCMRWPKYWSFSFSKSHSNEYIQDWFPLGLIGWISLLSKRLSRSSPTPQFKGISSSVLSFLYVQLSHPYMTTRKTIALTRWTFVGKVMSLLFNMLTRLLITFLPRSKRLLVSWLQSPSAVILEPKKIKSVTVSTVSSSVCHEEMGLDAMILVFWMLKFKPTFSLLSLSSRGSLVLLHFLP